MCWWWFITVLSPSLFVLLINGFSFGKVNNIMQLNFKNSKFKKKTDLENPPKNYKIKEHELREELRILRVVSNVWAFFCEETIVAVDLLACSPLHSPLSYCMATALSLLPLLSLTPLLCLTIISGPCVWCLCSLAAPPFLHQHSTPPLPQARARPPLPPYNVVMQNSPGEISVSCID